MINKKAIVFDRGLYLYLAQKLGEKLDKVYYYKPESSPYPESPQAKIGTGLPEVERVYNFHKYIDKVDYLIFFDCYDGEDQEFYRSKGYKVFGSGLSEIVEMDKVFFIEKLMELKMAIPKTYRAEGIQDMLDYLKGKKDKFIKSVRHRGDFETYHYKSMRQAIHWLDELKHNVGSREKEIEILIQDPVKSACEAGYDGFCVNGDFTSNCLCGYEIKDKGLVAKVFPETPEVLSYVNDKFAPLFKKLGYQGHWSTEIRITEDGTPYFIDPTVRGPSPPSELMCEIYENYAEAVLDIADGKAPVLKPKAKYGAEIILKSEWHKEHKLTVEFPKEISQWVKLKNHTWKDGAYDCIPNKNAGYFGAVVAIGNSVKEVTEKAKEYAEQIEADELCFDDSVFDKANEAIESGKKFGLGF
jgi:hypothetical protein